jgi:hypothetical protein
MSMSSFIGRAAIASASLALAACAYEVTYRPDYVPREAPAYIAQGRLLILMPQEQREFVYRGSPNSATGEFTTLTIPMGNIVEDIAKQVFGGCFAYGVDVVDTLDGQDGYVLALEGDMEDFAYSYTKVVDQGFDERDTQTWFVPEVDISLHVKARNRSGAVVLDETYDSGIRAGDRYVVTGRPAERINATLHRTLHSLMLELAGDVRPLLMGECELAEVAGGA